MCAIMKQKIRANGLIAIDIILINISIILAYLQDLILDTIVFREFFATHIKTCVIGNLC